MAGKCHDIGRSSAAHLIKKQLPTRLGLNVEITI